MIIAISNQKGGCGKTTTAINLSASLAAQGRRTLLLDLDPQAHATFGLGARIDLQDNSMYNVLTDRSERRQFIESVIQPVSENLDLVPGHILLSTIEQEYAEKEQAVGRLLSVLEHMSFPYKDIVIDCPPSLGFLTFNALRASDLVIVPLDLSAFSLMGIEKLLSMIELIRVKMNHTPLIYALATMVDLRSVFSRGMIDQIREGFKEHIFDSHIHMNIAIREAQAKGVAVSQHDIESKAALDYRRLAQEIIELDIDEVMPASDEADMQNNRIRNFVVNAPEASDVHLVGDFNGWTISTESKLKSMGKGMWQKRLVLSSGRYRYRFVVDGKWIADPENTVAEPNPHGGVDSILDIS